MTLTLRKEAPHGGRIAVDHLDDALVQSVEASLWVELLETSDADLASVSAKNFYPSVLDYLHGDVVHEVHQALQFLADLGNEQGAEAIAAAIARAGLRAPKSLAKDTPESAVIRLCVLGRDDPGWISALTAAWSSIAERARSGKFLREFPGVGQGELRTGDEARTKMLAALRKLLPQNKLVFQQLQLREHEASTTAVVLFGGRERVRLIADDLKRERQKQRWALSDVLRYDHATNILSIATRYRSLADGYRRLAGTALFGSSGYFNADEQWSLESLRDADAERLDGVRDHFGLSSLRLRSIVWQAHGKTRISIEGADVLGHLGELPNRRTGTIVAACLQFTTPQSGVGIENIRVKLPSDLDCRSMHRARAAAVLRELGVAGPASLPAASVWALAEGTHSTESVVRALGRDSKALLEAGVIQRSKWHVGDAERSTLGWVLQTRRVAETFASKLNLRGEPRSLDGDWLWDAGTAGSSSSRLRVLLALREPPKGGDAVLAARIAAFGPSKVIVVYPEVDTWSLAQPATACHDLLDPPGGLVLQALTGADLTQFPLSVLGAGAPLVIGCRSKRVAVNGGDVVLTDAPFAMLLALASTSNDGRKPTARELADRTKKLRLSDSAARMAMSRLRERIEASAPAPSIFRDTGKGFVLAVRALVLEGA